MKTESEIMKNKKEIKWKCHNCGDVFSSINEQEFIEDSLEHVGVCLDINDFIERLETENGE